MRIIYVYLVANMISMQITFSLCASSFKSFVFHHKRLMTRSPCYKEVLSTELHDAQVFDIQQLLPHIWSTSISIFELCA